MAQDPAVDLPEDVERFVADHIESVAELEALLLMRRERHVPWGAPTLAERLYVEPDVAAALLQRLARRRFVRSVEGGYRFDPPDDLRHVVDHVAEVYSRMLISITRLIHAKPSSAVRSFADAFRLRDPE
jgi:hypothetical protein